MSITCAAIIKILCVSASAIGTTNIELRNHSFWASDTVRTETWSAEWMRSTEYPLPSIDRTRLEKACDEGDCVLYWRHCSVLAGKRTCKFSFDWGNGYLYSVKVEATDEIQLSKALTSIGIVVNWEKQRGMPLFWMIHEGKGDEPICTGLMITDDPPIPCHAPLD